MTPTQLMLFSQVLFLTLILASCILKENEAKWRCHKRGFSGDSDVKKGLLQAGRGLGRTVIVEKPQRSPAGGKMIARFFFKGAVRIVGFYFAGPPWIFGVLLISLAVLLLGLLSISGLGSALRTLASRP